MKLWKGSWIMFLAAALVLGLGACGDDEENGGGGGDVRPPGQQTDIGGGGPGSIDLPQTSLGVSGEQSIPSLGGGDTFDCSDIPAGENLGQSCQSPDACGPGGACAAADQAAGPQCFQICSPGNCTDMCNAGEQCVPLTNQQTGEDLEFAPGILAGACVAPPEGDQGAYEACGTADTGACADGAACNAFEQGATVGTCTPSCQGQGSACPQPHDGFTAQCALSAQGETTPTGCGYPCTVGDNATCPDGMNCVLAGQGGVCAR